MVQKDYTNCVFEPVAIIAVAVGVFHASFTIDMIFTPSSSVMSSIGATEFTMTTSLREKKYLYSKLITLKLHSWSLANFKSTFTRVTGIFEI